jgi:hypothetical protein
MQWVEEFDVDVLVRGFLLFLNSNDSWIADYQPRIERCQDAGRLVLVAIQAAVLIKDIREIPQISADDPALAFPMDTIPQWQTFACRTPDGLTLKESKHMGFAHACINNAAFRQFFQERLRLLIDSGADGVHIDELSTRYFALQEGYCDACTAGFRDYLARKYIPAELNARYGIADVQSFDFRHRLAEEGNVETPPESPLHKEWWLFQLSNLVQVEGEVLSFCKSYAGGQGRDFLVNANSFEPEFNPDRTIEMTLTNFAAIGTGMTINLRRGGSLVSTPRIPPLYSYAPLYRMAKGVTPHKSVTLFIDGPGGTGVIKEFPDQKQKALIRWMFAEAYAAGAHFHVPYPSLDYYGPLDECRRYARFIRDNRAIYQGASHLADVGVLFSYASEVWDYWVEPSSMEPNHNRQWYGLCQALTDASIQYDVLFAADGRIIPNDLTQDDLLAYPTLIVPWVYALSDEQVGLLQDYARGGGRLLIAGEFATYDEEKNERPSPVVVDFPPLGATVIPALDLEAYLNDPQGQRAVATLNELASLIPDRLVTITSPSVTAQLNQKGDTLYCHLVNKDLQDSGFRPQRSFQVGIAPPSGLSLTGANAAYLSPDLSNRQPSFLPLTRQNDVLEVTVPDLDVYGVLVIPGEEYGS